MIAVYVIQTCLILLGVLQFLYEIIRTFNDSLLTMLSRLVLFIFTIIAGFYAPYLQDLPMLFLVLITLLVLYISFKATNHFMSNYIHKDSKDLIPKR